MGLAVAAHAHGLAALCGQLRPFRGSQEEFFTLHKPEFFTLLGHPAAHVPGQPAGSGGGQPDLSPAVAINVEWNRRSWGRSRLSPVLQLPAGAG